jgi:hypothetical protein
MGFTEAYTAWRSLPFPPGSTEDTLDELHADLALADTWVADSVIPYVERGIYEPAQVDVLDTLRTLRNRAGALRDRGPDPGLAGRYIKYVDVLLRVYHEFLAVVSN